MFKFLKKLFGSAKSSGATTGTFNAEKKPALEQLHSDILIEKTKPTGTIPLPDGYDVFFDAPKKRHYPRHGGMFLFFHPGNELYSLNNNPVNCEWSISYDGALQIIEKYLKQSVKDKPNTF